MLQGIGTAVGAVAVLLAAKIGANTFENWRRQRLAERKAEQAERILTATYKVRRGLSHVRSPMMLAHELNAAEADLKEAGEWDKIFPESQRKKATTAQAYYNRLKRTREDQLALTECQPMARALFGEKLEKALEKLNHLFWTVQVYVDADYRDNTGVDAEHRKKIESTIWEGYPSAEKNEIDQTIATQVKLIEDTCVPILRLEKTSNGPS
jgi:hypothetical protein